MGIDEQQQFSPINEKFIDYLKTLVESLANIFMQMEVCYFIKVYYCCLKSEMEPLPAGSISVLKQKIRV